MKLAKFPSVCPVDGLVPKKATGAPPDRAENEALAVDCQMLPHLKLLSLIGGNILGPRKRGLVDHVVNIT